MKRITYVVFYGIAVLTGLGIAAVIYDAVAH